MTAREKLLAACVGSLLLLGGLVWGYRQVAAAFTSRQQRIVALENTLREKEQAVERSIAATKRLLAYEARSLPMDAQRRERARSLYQTWLIDTARQAGLAESKISAQTGARRTPTYEAHTFTLSGRMRLAELTDLLHRFYTSPLLHTLRSLRVRPIKDSKDLEISCTIEALSLLSAGSQRGLPAGPANRLAHAKLADYLNTFVARNLFGPPNRAPQLSAPAKVEGTTGRSLSFTAKASDDDKLDVVSVALEPGGPAGAALDRRSGEFRWTPAQAGTYEVRLRAADDEPGSADTLKTVVLAISEPKPAPPLPKPVAEATKPKPAFDDANHAFLSAITVSNGQEECWISIRTTGELKRVKVGQKLAVGGFEGVVLRIGERDLELKSEGKRWLVTLGETLGQADELPADEI